MPHQRLPLFRRRAQEILYDNLKAVVLSRLGSDIRFNPAFMEFSGVLASNLCHATFDVAMKKAKSKTEFTTCASVFWSDARPNGRTSIGCSRLAQGSGQCSNPSHHSERPVDRWDREKPFLIPLNPRSYDAAITQAVRSSHQALVRFQETSIPFRMRTPTKR